MDSEIRSGIGDRVGDGVGDGIGDGISSGIGGGKLDIYCCQHVRPSLRLIETPPASLTNNSAKPLPQRYPETAKERKALNNNKARSISELLLEIRTETGL